MLHASDQKKRSWIHTRWVSIAACIVFIGIFTLFWSRISSLLSFAKKEHITFSLLSALITKSYPYPTVADRVSLLILGNAGGAHDGADLTDAMIYVSVHTKQDDVVILSLPRDIWIPTLKQKINAAYPIGESKKKGGGALLAKASVDEVIGQMPDYVWTIDFAGFTQIIDHIGGITITVPERIDDPKYPIPGKENDDCQGDPEVLCRYEHLVIEKGTQHMDGTLALKYARSRQASGDEGTDFSRSKRQQQILMAIKDTLLQQHIWKSPTMMYTLWNDMISSTKTDMPLGNTLAFLRRIASIPDAHMRRIVLDEGDKKTKRPGLLINPPPSVYDGLWVLAPRSGSYKEIHAYVACHLASTTCDIHP